MHAVLRRRSPRTGATIPSRSTAWAEDYANDPTYDPKLWLLARDGAMPVGALAAGDHGWVGEVGVLTRIVGAGSRPPCSDARSHVRQRGSGA